MFWSFSEGGFKGRSLRKLLQSRTGSWGLGYLRQRLALPDLRETCLGSRV